MERLIVLGTGYAMATKCYNTCFAIDDGQEYLLCDAGGGNRILEQFEQTGIDAGRIHHVIVTHEHCDHTLGIIWVIRKIATMIKSGKYEGNLTFYTHPRLAEALQQMAKFTLQKKFTDLFGSRILFVPIADGTVIPMLGYEVTFFDIHSTKAEQYGFTLTLHDGQRLTCMGDEPYNPLCERYIRGSDWLLSEAFCLYGDRDRFKPYEKHHSTVKDACELAESLGICNLVLWHTEDKKIARRKELYSAEGRTYFHGNLMVPNDLEVICLSR